MQTVTTSQHHVKTVASELNLNDLNEKAHASLSGVTTSLHHVKTVSGDIDLADLNEKSYDSLTDKPSGVDLGIGIESDTIIHSNDTERSAQTTEYVKLKEIICHENIKGLRVSWQHKVSLGDDGYTRLYVNGVPISTERLNYTSTYETETQDISDIEIDDLIQIYGKVDMGSDFIFVRNMKIMYDNYINNDP